MPSSKPRHVRTSRAAALALTALIGLTMLTALIGLTVLGATGWAAHRPATAEPAPGQVPQARGPVPQARGPVAPASPVQPPAAEPETAGVPGRAEAERAAAATWRPTDEVPHQAPLLRATRPAPIASSTGTATGTVTLSRVPGEWVSWALLDRRTGTVVTGGDAGTNSTESMIKAWIAADYLQGLGGREPDSGEIDLLRRMIRDSDDRAAETLYQRRGGDPVIRRLIATCGLTGTRVFSGWWSLTQVPAPDAVRMADCIADGRATNRRWTGWLLSELRQVRGEGRFGIVEVRPGVAIKNGWTRWWDGTWHVNCLAVADGWSLAVLTRYPAGLGLGHGAEACRSVTRQLAP